MNLILMHREPEVDFILLHNVLQYSFFEMFFSFQSTADPVNELIVVIKYVVSLLNSGSKLSKMLASLKSTIATLV